MNDPVRKEPFVMIAVSLSPDYLDLAVHAPQRHPEAPGFLQGPPLLLRPGGPWPGVTHFSDRNFKLMIEARSPRKDSRRTARTTA